MYNKNVRQAAQNRIRDRLRIGGSAPADQHVKQVLAGISSKIPAERRSREEDFEKL